MSIVDLAKKWHLEFYQVYHDFTNAISPQNLDETLKNIWVSESTYQDLQFKCNCSALTQLV